MAFLVVRVGRMPRRCAATDSPNSSKEDKLTGEDVKTRVDLSILKRLKQKITWNFRNFMDVKRYNGLNTPDKRKKNVFLNKMD